MGFFSGGKKKVPIHVIADDLSNLAIENCSQANIPEHLRDEFKFEGQDQRWQEWLALNMFFVSVAIQNAVENKNVCKVLLDNFHASTYKKSFEDDRRRIAFETLLNERYTTYYDLFRPQDENKYQRIGSFFLEKFSSKNILVLHYAMEIVSSRMRIIRDYLKQTSTKFDLV